MIGCVAVTLPDLRNLRIFGLFGACFVKDFRKYYRSYLLWIQLEWLQLPVLVHPRQVLRILQMPGMGSFKAGEKGWVICCSAKGLWRGFLCIVDCIRLSICPSCIVYLCEISFKKCWNCGLAALESLIYEVQNLEAILWNFTTKKHKVDDYLLILCAFFHRIHVQNTGILATYRNIIIKRNYVVTPVQYKLRPVSAAFMFVMHQICNEKWWMTLLNKIG